MCTSCSPSSTRRATASAQRMARSRSLTDRPTDRLIRCHSLRKRSDFGRLRRDERVAQHQEGPSCWPTASVGSAGAVETRHDVVTGWNANDQKTRGRCRLSRDCDVPVTLAVQSRLLSLCLPPVPQSSTTAGSGGVFSRNEWCIVNGTCIDKLQNSSNGSIALASSCTGQATPWYLSTASSCARRCARRH